MIVCSFDPEEDVTYNMKEEKGLQDGKRELGDEDL